MQHVLVEDVETVAEKTTTTTTTTSWKSLCSYGDLPDGTSFLASWAAVMMASSPQLEVSCVEVSQQHTATTTTKIAKAIIVQIHSVDSIVFLHLYFFFGTNYVERVRIYGSSAMNGISCAFKWSSTSMECITQCEYSQCYLAFIKSSTLTLLCNSFNNSTATTIIMNNHTYYDERGWSALRMQNACKSNEIHFKFETPCGDGDSWEKKKISLLPFVENEIITWHSPPSLSFRRRMRKVLIITVK